MYMYNYTGVPKLSPLEIQLEPIMKVLLFCYQNCKSYFIQQKLIIFMKFAATTVNLGSKKNTRTVDQ